MPAVRLHIPPNDAPAPIKIAIYLLYLELFAVVVDAALIIGNYVTENGPESAWAIITFALAGSFIQYLLIALLAKGQNWARIFYIGMTLLRSFRDLRGVETDTSEGIVFGFDPTYHLLIAVLASILMLLPHSSAWFRESEKSSTD